MKTVPSELLLFSLPLVSMVLAWEIVTHNEELAEMADRRLVMRDGVIGSPIRRSVDLVVTA